MRVPPITQRIIMLTPSTLIKRLILIPTTPSEQSPNKLGNEFNFKKHVLAISGRIF